MTKRQRVEAIMTKLKIGDLIAIGFIVLLILIVVEKKPPYTEFNGVGGFYVTDLI
jgi:hypothetical protein